MFREANFLHAHLIAQEFDNFVSFGRVCFPLDTRINIFGVFTEDNHIGQLRVFNRARGALIVTYRTQANVEIQLLTQRHVQRTDAAANWRRQRTFNSNTVITNQIEGFSRQPDILAVNVGRFFTGVNFHPGNFTLAFIGFLNGGINHFQHRWGNVNTDTVAFNERDNRVMRDVQFAVLQGDFLTFRRNYYFAFH